MARWMGGWMSEILSVSLVLTIVWSKILKGSIAHILHSLSTLLKDLTLYPKQRHLRHRCYTKRRE